MSKQADGLEAVRVVQQTLEPFKEEERERIIRWACELLGMSPPSIKAQGAAVPHHGETGLGHASTSADLGHEAAATSGHGRRSTDIRSFMAAKDPKSDQHFAAVVAYYFQFEAPSNERKDAISADDLIEACRKADRRRPKVPSQTLVNASQAGLLDKAGEKGKYRVNSVGENLVAMVLPAGDGTTGSARGKAKGVKRKAGASKARGAKARAKKK